MTISYAGVDLGYQTDELLSFIEQNIDPNEAFSFAARTFPGTRLASLPFRQGQNPPPCRINRLYWPVGASRFSVFYGLVDAVQLAAIRAVIYSVETPHTGYEAAPLVMSDGLNGFSTDMWMLPPRPLQTLTDLPLHLLVLVDERYFHWFRSSALLVTGGTTTWDELFEQIASALGIILEVDDIPAAYLLPGDGFSLVDEPLPLILDAVCASVGLRLVRQLDGTYRARTAEDSRDETEIQVALLEARTPGLDGSAGGAFGIGTSVPLIDDVAVLPESVEVIYKVSDSGVDAGEIAYAVTLASLLLDDFAGVTGFPGVKTFHCSAVALGTGTPTNDAELTALTAQIATDFYRWQCGRLDLRLVGYPGWTLTGLDDCAIYDHQGDCATRISRGPWFDHLEELLVWTAPQPGTGATLAVGEVDLSPFIDPTSVLLFDQDDGFVVTEVAPGVAQVNFTSSGGSECWPAYFAALDTDQNDYDPSPLLWWQLTRGTSPTNVNITGIVAAGNGCPLLITNAGATLGSGFTTSTITLKCSSTASSAFNRILNPDGLAVDVVITSGRSVLLRYDTQITRWRCVEWREYDAAASVRGLVNTSNQVMGAGAKYFTDKVGIGTSSPLANSALDVRGYTYAYFAGIISFGGGNSPGSELAGAILQYNGGVSPAISLGFAGAPGQVTGIFIDGRQGKFVLRHRTASRPRYAFHNDDNNVDVEGITGVINPGAFATGGLVTGPGTAPPLPVAGTGTGGAPLPTGTGGTALVQTPGSFMLAAQRAASDFPVSGTQQELIAQPPGFKFTDYVVEIVQPFVQSVPGSPTVDIGTVSSPTAYIAGGNLAQARGGFAISPPVLTLGGLNSLIAPTSIKVRVNYTGSLLSGEFRVHLKQDYVADVGLAAPSTIGPRITLPPDEADEGGFAIIRGGTPQPLVSIGP